MQRGITRRSFLRSTAGVGVGLMVLRNASAARTYAANEAARIALIGAAGRGLWFAGLLPRTRGMDLVALCDVDEYKARGVFEKFAKLPKFNDFRVMLDKMHKGIDGVIVATPDNTHAVASAAALRHGKAVYTEKPLTHDVYESHVLRKLARETQDLDALHQALGAIPDLQLNFPPLDTDQTIVRHRCETPHLGRPGRGEILSIKGCPGSPGGNLPDGVLIVGIH